jgi:hypothetical protein
VRRSYRALAVGSVATALVTAAGLALAAAPPTPAELSGSHPVAAAQPVDLALLRSQLAEIGATADGLLRQLELLQQQLVDPTPQVATSGPPVSTGRPASTPATTVAAQPTTAGAGPSSVVTTAAPSPTSATRTSTPTATRTQSTTPPRPTRSGGEDD